MCLRAKISITHNEHKIGLPNFPHFEVATFLQACNHCGMGLPGLNAALLLA
jgi:hypothetical protein